jgi:hypothetical protein
MSVLLREPFANVAATCWNWKSSTSTRIDLQRLTEKERAGLERLNNAIREAVEVIRTLPSTRDHLDKFLNPAWIR